MVKSKTSNKAAPADRVASKTLIFDNGAHTIKAGFSSPEPQLSDCHLIPNCIARSQRDKLTYIAADLDTCGDFGELQIRRPVEKGFIVNWEAEKAIWERTIFDKRSVLFSDPHEVNLILTEAPNAPIVLQRNADEIVFEEFEFASLWRGVGTTLNAYALSPWAIMPTSSATAPGTPLECLLVVDAGYSYTTVTPLYHGRMLHPAVRRLEVGGKTLTNYLKEKLTTRTTDVHREEWICQEIKEDVCYVAADSSDFTSHLERVWKGGQRDPREIDTSIVVDYILPDYEQLKRGFPQPHDPSKSAKMRRLAGENFLPVGNERFTVPELLFTPSDIGMQQEGIAETIMQSLNALPKGLWQPFLANVLVIGGTSKLPGLIERLDSDLRSKVDDSYLIRVARAEDPLRNTWLGGARIAQNTDLLKSLVVTRQEYFEHGDVWTRRKFAGKLG